MNAAKTLLSRMDSEPAAKAPAGANPAAAPTSPTTAPQARVRRTRAAQPQLDAEAERLRNGIRRAVAIVQGLIG